MSKFVDGVTFTEEHKVGPPGTPAALFTDLGVWDEPDPVQRVAVHDWLNENEPEPNLRMVLEFRGFIDADGRPLS